MEKTGILVRNAIIAGAVFLITTGCETPFAAELSNNLYQRAKHIGTQEAQKELDNQVRKAEKELRGAVKDAIEGELALTCDDVYDGFCQDASDIFNGKTTEKTPTMQAIYDNCCNNEGSGGGASPNAVYLGS